jgi:hypothetical protein
MYLYRCAPHTPNGKWHPRGRWLNFESPAACNNKQQATRRSLLQLHVTWCCARGGTAVPAPPRWAWCYVLCAIAHMHDACRCVRASPPRTQGGKCGSCCYSSRCLFLPGCPVLSAPAGAAAPSACQLLPGLPPVFTRASTPGTKLSSTAARLMCTRCVRAS